MNRKPKRPRRQKRARPGEPQVITRAVTHIRLVDVNPGKLATLDELAPIYLALCQHYITLFCIEETPNNLRTPLYATPLSERWHREGLGATRLTIAEQAAAPVLLVRRGPRPGGLAPPESRTRFTWSLTSAAR